MSVEDVPHRAGFVAIIGRPNVGKSTLQNALVGEKVSIVTPKPQTTRTRIQGIVNRPHAQLIFVDTPGLVKPSSALNRAMHRVTRDTAAAADVTLIVAAIRGSVPELADEDRELVRLARMGEGPVVLAINKIDKLPAMDVLLPWIDVFSRELEVDAIVPISALRQDGLEILMDELEKRLPESPALFPPDVHTDQIERVLCAELVREQVLMQLRQEVPHSATTVIEVFEDDRREDGAGLVRLEGRIFVERESQKGIVVGHRGAMVKSISEAARHQIEAMLGCKVYLRLQVVVDEDWTEREAAVRKHGFGLPED